jgi:hypothetical protein
MNQEKIQALNEIAKSIVQTIGEVDFAPSGPLYAALHAKGATLNQYNSLMAALVKKGYLTHDAEAHTYTCTKAGRVYSGLETKVPA